MIYPNKNTAKINQPRYVKIFSCNILSAKTPLIINAQPWTIIRVEYQRLISTAFLIF
jgi:hypothetical protein